MSIKNGDMPNIVKFINSEHDSIEFTECSGDILVAIDNQGPHVNDLAYYSLTKSDLVHLVSKLTALLAKLEEKGDE